MKTLGRFLEYWRTTHARDRELVEAMVRPEYRSPGTDLDQALEDWPGVHYWATGKDDGRLVLIRTIGEQGRERWWLHVGLFLLTFVTIWMGGALLAGVQTSAIPHGDLGLRGTGAAMLTWAERSAGALPFAMALMTILLAHELGHYFAARRYGIDASPPYFLPAPIDINFVGTFGAFIRLRTPVIDRRQLLDVGAAGPWAGFVVAAALLMIGLAQSRVLPPGAHPEGMLVFIGNTPLALGDSMFTWFARAWVVGDAGTILLDPLAYAGWLGLFVTTLNLLPLGQLDGGHIFYAMAGRWQTVVAWLTLGGMVVLGALQGPSIWQRWWWLFAALVLVLGAGRLGHPRLLEGRRPLPTSRVLYAWSSVLLFVVTFSPFPITILLGS